MPCYRRAIGRVDRVDRVTEYLDLGLLRIQSVVGIGWNIRHHGSEAIRQRLSEWVSSGRFIRTGQIARLSDIPLKRSYP